MPLDASQQKLLFQWLRAKGVCQQCPACGASSWMVGDIVVPPAAPGGGGTTVGGPSYPLAQMICENCGHVRHFASTLIGLDLQSATMRDESRE